MSDIFLGIDEEDLLLVPEGMLGPIFLSEQKPKTDWSYVISLPKDIRAVGCSSLSKTQSIWYDGDAYGYPLRPWVLSKLLPTDQRVEVGKQWLEAKARSLSSVILGGGREERCYADWVIRNTGEGVYEHLYAPFIHKRFGMDGRELSSQLARTLHEEHIENQYHIYTSSYDASKAQWASSMDGFLVEGNRITHVCVDGKEHKVDGVLRVALPIDMILSLLPDVPKSILVDAKYVKYRDACWVRVSGDCSEFATETQFWDSHHPIMLLHRISNTQALISYASDQKAKLQGWLAAKNLTVEQEKTLRSWTPIWKMQSHFRYYRIARYLQDLGIDLVGKRALFSHLSMLELHQRKEENAEVSLSDFLRLVV